MTPATREAAAGFYSFCQAFFSGDQLTARAIWETLPSDREAFYAGCGQWFGDWAAASPEQLPPSTGSAP